MGKSSDKPIDWGKNPRVVLLSGKEAYFKDQEVDRARVAFGDYGFEEGRPK